MLVSTLLDTIVEGRVSGDINPMFSVAGNLNGLVKQHPLPHPVKRSESIDTQSMHVLISDSSKGV